MVKLQEDAAIEMGDKKESVDIVGDQKGGEVDCDDVNVDNMENDEKNPNETLLSAALGEHMTIELPDNIYAACLVLPYAKIGYNKCQDMWLDFQVMGLLFINGFLQISLVAFVWIVYKEKLDETNEDKYLGKCGGYKTEGFLRIICVVVYIGFCVADLQETFHMFTWLVTLTGNPFEAITTKFWDCVEMCTFGCCKNIRDKAADVVEYKIVDPDGKEDPICTELAQEVGKMSCLRKVYSFCGVVLFKWAVAIALICYGTGFVVITDADEDLILNALALTFVLEIDDMCYQYCLSSDMKKIMSDYAPRIRMKLNQDTDSVVKSVGILLRCAVLGVLAFLTLSTFCSELWVDGTLRGKGN